MPYALLKVTPEWFTEMLKSLKQGGTRRYDVVENALPEDARVISVSTQWIGDAATLFIRLESEAFPELKELEQALFEPPVIQVYYDEPPA